MLTYRQEADSVVFVRAGTHSELFGRFPCETRFGGFLFGQSTLVMPPTLEKKLALLLAKAP